MIQLRKLLSYVGHVWNKEPNDVPIIEIQRGSGTYQMVTVAQSQLHFHDVNFRPNMPMKQSILLNDTMTMAQLVDAINGMGYAASVNIDAAILKLDEIASYALLEVTNVPIDTEQTLTMFRSPTWQILYPIARLLSEANGDIDSAITQMYAHSARGTWLEYWATFFGLQRLDGEDDIALSRRIFVTFMNLKTNNMAVKELLQFALKSDVLIEDTAPAEFTATVGMAYMNQVDTTRKLVDGIRGAGISYILNYKDSWSEYMPSIIADHAGKDFRNMDTLAGTSDLLYTEGTYGWNGASYLLGEGYNLSVEALQELFAQPTEVIDALSQSEYANEETSYPLPSEVMDSASQTAYSNDEDAYLNPSEDRTAQSEYTNTETAPAPADTTNGGASDYNPAETYTAPTESFNTIKTGHEELGFMYYGVTGFELNTGELNNVDILPASTTEDLSGSGTLPTYTEANVLPIDESSGDTTDATRAETYAQPTEVFAASDGTIPFDEDGYIQPTEDQWGDATDDQNYIEQWAIPLDEEPSDMMEFDTSEDYSHVVTEDVVLATDPYAYEENPYVTPSEDTSILSDMSSPMVENYGTLQEDMSYTNSFTPSESYATPAETLNSDGSTSYTPLEFPYWVGLDSFELNSSELNSSMTLASSRIAEGVSITMLDAQGYVIQTAVY